MEFNREGEGEGEGEGESEGEGGRGRGRGLCLNRTNGKDTRVRLRTSLATITSRFTENLRTIGRSRKIQDGCLLCILKNDMPNE